MIDFSHTHSIYLYSNMLTWKLSCHVLKLCIWNHNIHIFFKKWIVNFDKEFSSWTKKDIIIYVCSFWTPSPSLAYRRGISRYYIIFLSNSGSGDYIVRVRVICLIELYVPLYSKQISFQFSNSKKRRSLIAKDILYII